VLSWYQSCNPLRPSDVYRRCLGLCICSGSHHNVLGLILEKRHKKPSQEQDEGRRSVMLVSAILTQDAFVTDR